MSKFASGKYAVGICQRCGIKARLNVLVADGQLPNLLVHPWCRDIKHEQQKRQLKDDRIILRRPAPDLDDMSGGDHAGETLVDARHDGGPYFGGGT